MCYAEWGRPVVALSTTLDTVPPSSNRDEDDELTFMDVAPATLRELSPHDCRLRKSFLESGIEQLRPPAASCSLWERTKKTAAGAVAFPLAAWERLSDQR